MDRQIRLSGRALVAALAALFVVAVIAIPATRDRITSGFDPRAVASATDLVAQRDQAERSIGRGYRKALEQLRTARGLRLPIPDADAEAIFQRSIGELGALRREALAALAVAYGLVPADVTSYVTPAEARLEQLGDDRSGALLAPRLYAIVLRFDQLAQQLADKGTEQMTTAPSLSPRPSGR